MAGLGLAYAELGEIHRAIEYYQQPLLITREVGDRRGEGTAFWNMSLASERLGTRAQAISYAEAALEIFEQIEKRKAEKVRKQLEEWKRTRG